MTLPHAATDQPPPRREVPVDPSLELLARIEGLVGEEYALLAIPENDRTPKQNDRLREITDELDHVFVALKQRAARLGHRGGGEPSPT
jgi:hypothetical protein